ncbi:MAG: Sensor histidine kinase RcsC [Chroococcidiopsis sp. SAG 2025]|uniref:GAF domain-containing protein n=1 Tax=Chroococcidiopsis sp. SAG 2025 TaxID=171389 RepID=UPI002936F4DB|nr:GAF domain-containing protein [Chroococcidiopsis sp. SAG 2025]MDV2997898.1 Sensor histidine kinase RcsC [Chroococcidiopsis sp. SAG 2025]
MKQILDEELQLAPAIASGRTSEQILAEIESKFGFVPPFFGPAQQNPQVLENLWQQTLSAYVNNPLSARFKEKLSAYLSRFCAVPYCMICHSCTLRPLGMSAREVLELLETPPPVETDIDEHLNLLAAQPEPLAALLESNTKLEDSLFYCSIFIALQDSSEHCRQELRQLLGSVNYQHLVAFIAYTKSCHVWMEAYPEVALETDRRVQEHLGALLEDEPALADFFRNYRQKVKREQQSRAQQLAELAERQRQEEAWRQQAERERLVAQMAQCIRQSLNLEEILSTTVSEVRQFLQSERVFIYRFEPDWSGFVAVESVDSRWASILGMKCKDSFFGETSGRELYKQGRTHATEDIYTSRLSKCHADLLAQFQVRANLVVPIVQGEELWGLLVANHCSSPRQWQQMEIDLLKHLATQVAIAIQQSTLFEQVQTELVERQRSEEKIREQAALLDVASDAITVQNLEGQILFWNQGAERLYGWKAQEALGQSADFLYQETSLPLQQVQELTLDRGSWQGELYQVTKSGRKIVINSRWTLVRDEQGQPKSILVVNTDVTEKKQLEAQLLRAQRLESIGTLASGIAHDLNNVLGPILMVAELLQEKIPDSLTQQLLAEQKASAKRGAALVKQVLSFARGLEGKRTILQLRHLLMEIRQIAKQTFPKSIEIYTDISPNLWTVCADATQLHQVLMNLVVNARDAMPDGGTLSIHAENLFIDENYARMNLEASVGPYSVITVSDRGIGIVPEILERIFEPFFTTKEVGKGTGLGLSTAIGIIKSHGGFVTVESSMGVGTQFKVYLPAVEGTQQQQAEARELPKGHGELILVVDDELAICEITKISLENYNYKVLTANNGIEAIALYAQHKNDISVLLTDMMMPDMDGQTTIRILQKMNHSLKIIATSGLASNDKVAEAAGVGVKAFLSKPYTAPELLQTLSSVLGAKSSQFSPHQ